MKERLPRVTAKEIITVLEKVGFVFSSQTGSHRIYRKCPENLRATVPFHGNKILHPKVLKSILKEADIPIEQLSSLL